MKRVFFILAMITSITLPAQNAQSQYAPVIKEILADNNKITYSFPPHSFTRINIIVEKN